MIEGVICDYVFWDADGKERSPMDRVLEPGEFERLYSQLPTIEYVFENGFHPLDPAIMDRIVLAINERNPEFELQIDSINTRVKPPARSRVGRAARGLKSCLWLANQLGEEWFRHLLVWRYVRGGHVVLFDRHFLFDYYAHDIRSTDPARSLGHRLHGFFLDRFYPRPDLIIFLDAPGELLFARKKEGTVPLLERRRREYHDLRRHFGHFHVVDATQGLDTVTGEPAGSQDETGAQHGDAVC